MPPRSRPASGLPRPATGSTTVPNGQQFKARFLKTSAPTSAEGIEKYLASGMIRGIGPVYAKKLLRAFGDKVFDVIEAEPDRLREVDGIGPIRAGRITAAWAEQKACVRNPSPEEIAARQETEPVSFSRLARGITSFGFLAGASRCSQSK